MDRWGLSADRLARAVKIKVWNMCSFGHLGNRNSNLEIKTDIAGQLD